MSTADCSTVIRPTWAESGDCCPTPLGQISYCAMACAFIQLLPTGPMWDRPKAEAMAIYQEQQGAGRCDPAQCAPAEPNEDQTCTTMVQYSIYLANLLMDTLLNALWPSLREADPFRAVTTLDEWLDRLGWEDCFRSACRSPALGPLSPYEVMGECGPIYCPVPIPEGLECAIKRGLVHALSRANMGGIRNACWINWVIEPLGAAIEITGECGSEVVTLVPISDTLPACPVDLCPVAIDEPQGTVDAVIILNDCDRPAGMPDELRPALYSAECIVRSLLPPRLARNVRRSC
jgi:hypothetical protein